MSTFLSKDVLAGLEAAQKMSLKQKTRLFVKFNKNYFPVMRLTKNGFSVEAEMAPMIRGLVDLYDVDRHLKQCLLVASKEENWLVHFVFKRENIVKCLDIYYNCNLRNNYNCCRKFR